MELQGEVNRYLTQRMEEEKNMTGDKDLKAAEEKYGEEEAEEEEE